MFILQSRRMLARAIHPDPVVAQHVLPHLEHAGALGPHAAEWIIFAKPLEAVLADTATVN